MSNTPFAPFQPPGTIPTPQGDPPLPESPRDKDKREKREAREAKAAAKAAQPPAEPRQKRKKANGDKPSLKFDLQTILGAASELNADDYPLFEKMINLLDEAGKPGRERLLAAIQKVFA